MFPVPWSHTAMVGWKWQHGYKENLMHSNVTGVNGCV